MFGFVGGDEARDVQRMPPQAERRQAVLDELRRRSSGARRVNPRDFFETDWTTEQWTRGCPVGIAGPGTLLAYGDRRCARRSGRIHWAGTETSNYWNGYMDGAVRSGERAAAEVLDEL